ncbi:MAG: LptF/LptG family permease, partial [Candidatus Aureabacteria bacterium]|nr:LptF/LptG family permease [Candidatus Auribacterota bacterium]
MKIIHKYLLKEIVAPFFLALFVITFILLFVEIDRIADSVINKGVSLGTVLVILGNLALYLFHITIPIAFMAAVLLALGRMSSENEILALRSLGISLHTLIVPVIILAGLLSFILLFMQDKVFPNIENRIERIFYNMARESRAFSIKEKEFIELGDYTFYIQKIDGNLIKDVTIYEPVGNKTHRTVTAREGEYTMLK